jgi:hypothetical protein
MQWRRSTVSFALSLAGFTSALATPVLGRMIDRWGIRPVALPGLALFAASLGLLSLSPRSPVAFVFLAALAGAVSSAQTPPPYAKAHFGLVRRSSRPRAWHRHGGDWASSDRLCGLAQRLCWPGRHHVRRLLPSRCARHPRAWRECRAWRRANDAPPTRRRDCA